MMRRIGPPRRLLSCLVLAVLVVGPLLVPGPASATSSFHDGHGARLGGWQWSTDVHELASDESVDTAAGWRRSAAEPAAIGGVAVDPSGKVFALGIPGGIAIYRPAHSRAVTVVPIEGLSLNVHEHDVAAAETHRRVARAVGERLVVASSEVGGWVVEMDRRLHHPGSPLEALAGDVPTRVLLSELHQGFVYRWSWDGAFEAHRPETERALWQATFATALAPPVHVPGAVGFLLASESEAVGEMRMAEILFVSEETGAIRQIGIIPFAGTLTLAAQGRTIAVVDDDRLRVFEWLRNVGSVAAGTQPGMELLPAGDLQFEGAGPAEVGFTTDRAVNVLRTAERRFLRAVPDGPGQWATDAAMEGVPFLHVLAGGDRAVYATGSGELRLHTKDVLTASERATAALGDHKVVRTIGAATYLLVDRETGTVSVGKSDVLDNREPRLRVGGFPADCRITRQQVKAPSLSLQVEDDRAVTVVHYEWLTRASGPGGPGLDGDGSAGTEFQRFVLDVQVPDAASGIRWFVLDEQGALAHHTCRFKEEAPLDVIDLETSETPEELAGPVRRQDASLGSTGLQPDAASEASSPAPGKESMGLVHGILLTVDAVLVAALLVVVALALRRRT